MRKITRLAATLVILALFALALPATAKKNVLDFGDDPAPAPGEKMLILPVELLEKNIAYEITDKKGVIAVQLWVAKNEDSLVEETQYLPETGAAIIVIGTDAEIRAGEARILFVLSPWGFVPRSLKEDTPMVTRKQFDALMLIAIEQGKPIRLAPKATLKFAKMR